MGLSELRAMVASGEITQREANEIDGVSDKSAYCDVCQELFDEDDLTNCEYCGELICQDCFVGGAYCSTDCLMEDCKDDS